MDVLIQEQVINSLLKKKAIKKKDLQKIADSINNTGKAFEEVILSFGVDKRVYLAILSSIYKCEWIDFDTIKLEPELVTLIPRGMAERYRILSVGKRNNQLIAAMSDPRDVFAKEYVSMRTGLEVVPKLTLEKEIMNAIKTLYPDTVHTMPIDTSAAGGSELTAKPSVIETVGRGGKDCVDENSFRTASKGRFIKWGSATSQVSSPTLSKKTQRVIEADLPKFPDVSSTCTLSLCSPPAVLQEDLNAVAVTVKQQQLTDRERDMLSFLCQLGQDLSATLDVESLLLKIVEAAKHITNAEGSSILLYDGTLNVLYFKCVKGEHGEEIKKAILPIDEHSIAGWVALHGKGIRVSDVSTDPRHCKTIDDLTGFKTKSLLCLPILFRGRLLGVMETVNKIGAQAFGSEDEGFLLCLANQAGVALANAEKFEDLEEYFTQTVDLLVSAVEALQPVLKGHIAEVARLSAAIAHEMGITGEEYVNIAYAALLHDVGNLQLSGTSLEQLEREHTIVGARILSEMRKLQHVAPYVKYHHERYDGTGFPDGLTGDSIPLGSRILGLAEHYSEWKFHREGDGTVEQFLSFFAKQHDPKVVEAFKRITSQSSPDPLQGEKV